MMLGMDIASSIIAAAGQRTEESGLEAQLFVAEILK
jgi:hypothetical protein